MTEVPSIKEVLNRIQDQIFDLQGEHEVMAGPFDASKWKIEVSVTDLQTLVATLQPSGERREVIARIMRAWGEFGCDDESESKNVNYCIDALAKHGLLASGFVQDEASMRQKIAQEIEEMSDCSPKFIAERIREGK